jgi:hypothetical protein
MPGLRSKGARNRVRRAARWEARKPCLAHPCHVVISWRLASRWRVALDRMRECTGFDILVCMLQFGVMADDLVKRNMEMFAADVTPHFRG